MKCSQCNKDMSVVGTEYTSELDSTDVYANLKFVCINSKCAMYSGKDLKKPKHSPKIDKVKMNNLNNVDN